MPATRRRRIVRRAVMAVAVVVLTVLYAVGYAGVYWCDGRGVLNERFLGIVKSSYLPLDLYCETDMPGADWLSVKRLVWKLDGARRVKFSVD